MKNQKPTKTLKNYTKQSKKLETQPSNNLNTAKLKQLFSTSKSFQKLKKGQIRNNKGKYFIIKIVATYSMYKYNNCNFPINISCCGQPLYAGSRKLAVSQYTRACGQRNMKVF